MNVNIWNDSDFKIDVNIIEDEPLATSIEDGGSGQWDKWNNKSMRLIPFSDYMGSEDQSEEDFKSDHSDSPMLKRKKEVPDDMGSNRYAKRLPYQYRWQMRREKKEN